MSLHDAGLRAVAEACPLLHPWISVVNEKKYPRKLAAVLSADVKGYTRLMAAAEEDAHRLTTNRLDLFRTHIASFDG
ncbi:MAG: hypothetical protein ACREEV_12515, partial [Dongiaceae bacterium]